jgi:uncharacterized protein (DUF885 family)
MKLACTFFALGSLTFCTNLHATPADDEFQKLAGDYIEEYLHANPEQATELGDHRFDHLLTDYSAEARAKELAGLKTLLARLNDFKGAADLTGANSVDFRLLKDNVEGSIFEAEEMKEADWNPLVYNQSLANSLYLLIAREFAPPAEKVPNMRARMEGIPAVIAQAKTNLKHPPKIYTETAIEQAQGAISFVREGLGPVLDRVPQAKKELAALQEKTAAALEEYKKWLETDLLPRSDGDFRIGAEKFRKKLRFSLASDMSAEELMQHARADLAATQSAIYEAALPLYKKYFPDAKQDSLGDKKKVTNDVLAKLAEQHPNDDTIVGYAEKALSQATTFTRKKNLVTVFEQPLKVIVMPEFKRGRGIAYCDSAGPLEKNGETFFAIEPTPTGWSKERKDSFFREYNNNMVQDLTIHEAMPGHYLQLAHAQEHLELVVCSFFAFVAMTTYDAVIIGGGPGGAPQVGQRTACARLRIV